MVFFMKRKSRKVQSLRDPSKIYETILDDRRVELKLLETTEAEINFFIHCNKSENNKGQSRERQVSRNASHFSDAQKKINGNSFLC